jgi:hypothetical protein
MALELAMRSVADGSSASGHSANGRSRLAEARWHSGLLVGSEEMSSRGYDGMLPTFQKRRQAGEIRRRRGLRSMKSRDTAETDSGRQRDIVSWQTWTAALNKTHTTHMHKSGVAWVQMYPRYAEKVPCRYRSARSLAFSTLPCESWAGRAGLHGLDGRSRVSGSAAFVHSCPPPT